MFVESRIIIGPVKASYALIKDTECVTNINFAKSCITFF